ncbi:hypothetical protein KIH74_21625 [Kineosporia sp. J2-2]|uniref:Nucleoside-diphosphate-sugar epimerase n=1 Tax=Kineosporia corallincola TaxID=2835133 RepID=A0ABS5TNC0_9ACTN|nr:hypothetical protein [Kineosporia corallincola]MBT0771553.1 hypothetical protein [Kineosporia corallincola]
MTKTLVLGGSAWLGRAIAVRALSRGHEVTCLARGEAGAFAEGVRVVTADRAAPGAYDEVSATDWDVVVDVSWQPGLVRSALAALGERAATWQYVSSCSVYADHSTPDADESAALLPALSTDTAGRETYGEAKVACEQLCSQAVGDRLLIARAGLIGGYGDGSDRFGYWPARFASPRDGQPVLVPDEPGMPTQTIDVLDLAAWLVACGENATVGTFNVGGPVTPLGRVLEIARELAGSTAGVVPASSSWLLEQEVEEFAGPRSLPLWIADPAWAGFSHRNTDAAVRAGLTWRPVEETAGAALRWERELGLDRERRAGLSAAQERELLTAWSHHGD